MWRQAGSKEGSRDDTFIARDFLFQPSAIVLQIEEENRVEESYSPNRIPNLPPGVQVRHYAL
jgi:hypothetical protein